MVAQAICNRQVVGSIPTTGSERRCVAASAGLHLTDFTVAPGDKTSGAGCSVQLWTGTEPEGHILFVMTTSPVDFGAPALPARRPRDQMGAMSSSPTSMLREFRAFILRGNVVDLAVAVAIGAAFTAVITSLVAAFITPIIGAVFGRDFSKLSFSVNGSVFKYGLFVNALLTFLITATVVFFFVVKPLQTLLRRLDMAPAEPLPSAACPKCLTEIPIISTRCRACTSELAEGWSSET